MEIVQYKYQPINSNMFVMLQNKSALIIDPSVQEKALALFSERNIENAVVLLTHEHYDHISGVNWIKENIQCEVLCSADCAEAIELPEKNLSQFYEILLMDKGDEVQKQIKAQNVRPYSCKADRILKDETEFEWEGQTVRFKYTPGHSKGSSCILVNNKYLFSGDSLVDGNKTITRLPGGSRKLFCKTTLPFLQNLPPDTVVCPGHGDRKSLFTIKWEDVI